MSDRDKAAEPRQGWTRPIIAEPLRKVTSPDQLPPPMNRKQRRAMERKLRQASVAPMGDLHDQG